MATRRARPHPPGDVQLGKPSPLTGHRLPVGAHPGHTGGKRGRSGRKPDEFKEMCRRLVSGDEIERELAKVLKDSSHPHYIAALRWASEHGYGKPTQKLEHAVDESLGELIDRSYAGG